MATWGSTAVVVSIHGLIEYSPAKNVGAVIAYWRGVAVRGIVMNQRYFLVFLQSIAVCCVSTNDLLCETANHSNLLCGGHRGASGPHRRTHSRRVGRGCARDVRRDRRAGQPVRARRQTARPP